jgi:signal transduction histidine kinase
VRLRDGSERYVQSRIDFLTHDDRRVAMVSLVRDLTAQRRAQEEAAAAARRREDLAAAVAHDVRTPITTIRTAVQFLRRLLGRGDPLTPAEIARRLEPVESAASRIAAIVTDLLPAPPDSGGRPRPALRETDLVELIHRVVRSHEYLSPHRLAVEATAPSLMGNWDADQLERVLDNLVGNAIKYSPNGGTVTVRARLEGPETAPPSSPTPAPPVHVAVVEVRDEGAGIPAAELPHVFDRFYRGERAMQLAPGSGLGLASAKRIVEQHGGTITVQSAERMGSTFTVRLPRC